MADHPDDSRHAPAAPRAEAGHRRDHGRDQESPGEGRTGPAGAGRTGPAALRHGLAAPAADPGVPGGGDAANPARDAGLNPLTTGAATGWGPEWVHRGRGEGVDTPLPYNPVSSSVAFQQFLQRPEEFAEAPQARREDPEGAGIDAGPPGPVARKGEARRWAHGQARNDGTPG